MGNQLQQCHAFRARSERYQLHRGLHNRHPGYLQALLPRRRHRRVRRTERHFDGGVPRQLLPDAGDLWEFRQLPAGGRERRAVHPCSPHAPADLRQYQRGRGAGREHPALRLLVPALQRRSLLQCADLRRNRLQRRLHLHLLRADLHDDHHEQHLQHCNEHHNDYDLYHHVHQVLHDHF